MAEHGHHGLVNLTLVLVCVSIVADDMSTALFFKEFRNNHELNRDYNVTLDERRTVQPLSWSQFLEEFGHTLRRMSERLSIWKLSYSSDSESSASESAEYSRRRISDRYGPNVSV